LFVDVNCVYFIFVIVVVDMTLIVVVVGAQTQVENDISTVNLLTHAT
jgi:hypothetical protein